MNEPGGARESKRNGRDHLDKMKHYSQVESDARERMLRYEVLDATTASLQQLQSSVVDILLPRVAQGELALSTLPRGACELSRQGDTACFQSAGWPTTDYVDDASCILRGVPSTPLRVEGFQTEASPQLFRSSMF